MPVRVLRFPHPDAAVVERALVGVPSVGRPIAPRSALACAVCGRRIGALGRLPWPGVPTCDADACALVRMGPVSRVFAGSPYGTAIRRSVVARFCRVVDLPSGQVLLQRLPLVSRACSFADGYVDLLRWQEAWEARERIVDPEAWREGRPTLLPPRGLDEVLAIRSVGAPVSIDPTLHLRPEDRALLHRLRKEGEEAVARDWRRPSSPARRLRG